MRVIEELARLPCKACKGDTATELVKGVRHLGICPDCQEDGKPTGLAFPQLTDLCPVDWGTHQESCVCGGTGRVLKSDAECLEALLEQMLRERKAIDFHYFYYSGVKRFFHCAFSQNDDLDFGVWFIGDGDTPLEALATAVRKIYEADNPR